MCLNSGIFTDSLIYTNHRKKAFNGLDYSYEKQTTRFQDEAEYDFISERNQGRGCFICKGGLCSFYKIIHTSDEQSTSLKSFY